MKFCTMSTWHRGVVTNGLGNGDNRAYLTKNNQIVDKGNGATGDIPACIEMAILRTGVNRACF